MKRTIAFFFLALTTVLFLTPGNGFPGPVRIGVDTSWRPIPEDGAPSGSGAMGSSFTNSLGMKFVWCPPGTFTMGSPSSEPGRYDDEPQHQVTLPRGFYMQTTEVTQGQWEKVMGNNPSYFQDCGADCPLANVSWDDAQGFIRKLNQMEGETYSLPTEAQWEYAARAGTNTAFYTGRCLSTDQANYDGNYPLLGCPKGQDRKTTVPVASFFPNAWGLYDMHGNVYEWCLDWYGNYPSGIVTDPTGPSSGSSHVIRGGGWLHYATNCRSACRSLQSPGHRNDLLGFRLSLPAVR
ncbi:MAG: formylglycine-generating enzyme family protein [Pseudomonadota bacterium]